MKYGLFKGQWVEIDKLGEEWRDNCVEMRNAEAWAVKVDNGLRFQTYLDLGWTNGMKDRKLL